MDRGAWWAPVHGVTKSWTQLTWHNSILLQGRTFFSLPLFLSLFTIDAIILILVDLPDAMRKNEYEKWYKASVDSNYGIWIGNGVADQNLIKTNIGFKKTNNEVQKGFGVVIKNTKTSLVNLVGNDKEGDNDEQ